MKNLALTLLSLILLLVSSSLALAALTPAQSANFKAAVLEKGLEGAMAEALLDGATTTDIIAAAVAEGATTADIVAAALANGLDGTKVVTALSSAGIPLAEINTATEGTAFAGTTPAPPEPRRVNLPPVTLSVTPLAASPAVI